MYRKQDYAAKFYTPAQLTVVLYYGGGGKGQGYDRTYGVWLDSWDLNTGNYFLKSGNISPSDKSVMCSSLGNEKMSVLFVLFFLIWIWM